MNDWWKLALAGTAGAGLLALTGGAAAPGLGALLGAEGGAAAAGTAGAAATGAAATGAAATGAAATGAAATGAAAADAAAAGAGGMLAGEGAGAAAGTLGGNSAAGMLGQVAASGEGLSGSLAGTDAAYGGVLGENASLLPQTFVTPPVTSSGPALSGTLDGTIMGYGSPTSLANAPSADPSMLQQLGGYAHDAGRAANAYSQVNNATGGNPPPRPPPQGRPIYQGAPPPIAQGPGAQPAPDQNAILAAIARRRQRGY